MFANIVVLFWGWGSLGPSCFFLLETGKQWHEFRCFWVVVNASIALQKSLVIIILTQYFAVLLLPFPCHDVLWNFFSFTLSSLNCSIKVSTLATQTKSFSFLTKSMLAYYITCAHSNSRTKVHSFDFVEAKKTMAHSATPTMMMILYQEGKKPHWDLCSSRESTRKHMFLLFFC